MADNVAIIQWQDNDNSVISDRPRGNIELACFRLEEPKAPARIRELRADTEVVRNLPLGSFVSYDCLDPRVQLAGQVF